MPNRLTDATSPYLLQHRDNPVDWYPWGDEAFAAARARGVPILLSVGYSACHWCHVMAHESFEDEATADDMNRWFVSVKVDREERPDVDRIYMDAVQAMTGRGGWPMTVFLTPEGRPFFAGTYFPAEDRHGHPSFRRVLAAVTEAWTTRRDELEGQAARLAGAIDRSIPPAPAPPDAADLRRALDSLAAAHDRRHGGFGTAPKFPQAPTLEFLLRIATAPWASEAGAMLDRTLLAMARGGIYDHLGGGFARYSVDDRWLVPHFEKMLYDNALLARLYAHAWRRSGEERFATVARETLDYLLRDLALPGGGFASAEDADSDGREGAFYVFTHDEFMQHGGERVSLAARYFGVTPEGNFEGANVLREAVGVDEIAAELGLPGHEVAEAVAAAREHLRELRSSRTRPGVDDKAVTAWNGLALRALAEAGWIFGEPGYLEAARGTARFLLEDLRLADGRLARARRGSRLSGPGFCDDYAATALGLFALYQATGEARWFHAAAALVDEVVERFADRDGGGFFATEADAEHLIVRPKNLMDNPVPSDNSLAAEALLHLEALAGSGAASRLLEETLRAAGALLDHPTAAGHLLAVAATRVAPPLEVAIVGKPDDPARSALVATVRDHGHPGVFLALGDGDDPGGVPLLDGRPTLAGRSAAYVCRGFVCDAPVTTPEALLSALSSGPG